MYIKFPLSQIPSSLGAQGTPTSPQHSVLAMLFLVSTIIGTDSGTIKLLKKNEIKIAYTYKCYYDGENVYTVD